MPRREQEQSIVPDKTDLGAFPYKPKLFDVKTALETRGVMYESDGSAVVRIPQLTGDESVTIPPGRQFPVIKQTYDDISFVMSEVANSPRLPNGQTLQEYVGQQNDIYQEALARAYENGQPEAPIGNFLYDSRTQSLAIVAPPEIHYLALRTSNSMYEDPQGRSLFEIWKTFRDTKFAFAGASVGGNILEGIVRNIGPKAIKIADFDPASAGNITRVNRGNIFHLANPRSDRSDPLNPYEESRPTKAAMQAREMLLIDPYMNIELYEEMLSGANMEDFLTGSDIAVEAIDQLDTKMELRRLAREMRVPLLMISDVDERVFWDFYDFKKNPNLPLVHGINDDDLGTLMDRARTGTRDDRAQMFKVLIGGSVQDGLLGVWLDGEGEHATASIPQHGATALGAGFVGANLMADFILGKEVPSRGFITTKLKQ